MANSYFNENTLEELIEEIKYVYKSDDRPWVIGYSGGKDSTTVVELVYKMLLGLDPDDRHKNVYIVSSDTLIENPLIKIYLSKMNDLLGQAADRDGLPIKSAMVTPPPNNSFWANVIGRGFPTPRMNGTFRWCTDRLKINPSGEYIHRVIDEEGNEVVVLLGVRKAESIARKRRIEGRELANRLLNRHETIQDAYVYNPNIYGNIQVLDGIKKDAKTISVAFSEVEKGIASTDDLDTLLMFSKDPLSKIERILSILQAVQKDIEYVARDVEKRRGNIFVDNGGDLSTRYVESRNTIEADSKTVMDWKVM